MSTYLTIQKATANDALEIAEMVAELLAEIMNVIGVQAFNFDISETVSILTKFTKHPLAEAGGFGLRTGSPDTHRLNDASFYGSVLKSSFGFDSK